MMLLHSSSSTGLRKGCLSPLAESPAFPGVLLPAISCKQPGPSSSSPATTDRSARSHLTYSSPLFQANPGTSRKTPLHEDPVGEPGLLSLPSRGRRLYLSSSFPWPEPATAEAAGLPSLSPPSSETLGIALAAAMVSSAEPPELTSRILLDQELQYPTQVSPVELGDLRLGLH